MPLRFRDEIATRGYILVDRGMHAARVAVGLLPLAMLLRFRNRRGLYLVEYSFTDTEHSAR